MWAVKTTETCVQMWRVKVRSRPSSLHRGTAGNRICMSFVCLVHAKKLQIKLILTLTFWLWKAPEMYTQVQYWSTCTLLPPTSANLWISTATGASSAERCLGLPRNAGKVSVCAEACCKSGGGGDAVLPEHDRHDPTAGMKAGWRAGVGSEVRWGEEMGSRHLQTAAVPAAVRQDGGKRNTGTHKGPLGERRTRWTVEPSGGGGVAGWWLGGGWQFNQS